MIEVEYEYERIGSIMFIILILHILHTSNLSIVIILNFLSEVRLYH